MVKWSGQPKTIPMGAWPNAFGKGLETPLGRDLVFKTLVAVAPTIADKLLKKKSKKRSAQRNDSEMQV